MHVNFRLSQSSLCRPALAFVQRCFICLSLPRPSLFDLQSLILIRLFPISDPPDSPDFRFLVSIYFTLPFSHSQSRLFFSDDFVTLLD